MRVPVLLPYIEFFGAPAFVSFETALACGFNGVEVHLQPRVIKKVPQYRALAAKLGLTLHFHQPWNVDDNPTYLFMRVLQTFGQLPRSGYRFDDHFAGVTEPIVAYPDRAEECAGRDNCWLQTCPTYRRDGLPRVAFVEFLDIVRRDHLSVVFDTQHYLEYRLGLTGVEGLPTDRYRLGELLAEGWGLLGKHVREIHLVDFDPRRGHTRGRNVFPGEGVLPLHGFCEMVVASGWSGSVVPEVSPLALWPRKRVRLAELFRIARWLFD